MSAAGATTAQLPAACSGLIYAGVPITCPKPVKSASVRLLLDVASLGIGKEPYATVTESPSAIQRLADDPVAAGSGGPIVLASPQSTTSVSPNAPSKMFAGFR